MAQLDILDVSKNAATGRIYMEARVMEVVNGTTVYGATENWSIEALEISTKYNGEVENWLGFVGREMLYRHRLRAAAHNSIDKWYKQRMDIKE